MKTVLILASSAILHSASGFTIPAARVLNNGAAPHSVYQTKNNHVVMPMDSRGINVLRQHMSSGGNDEATPRKRRKRKDGKQFSPPPAAETKSNDETKTIGDATTNNEPQPEETPAPVTPKENVVVMQVRDIRDVVSGAPESPTTAPVVQEAEADYDDDDELADDEEWEYYDVDEDGNEIIVPDEGRLEGRGQDDSIEQLLADARSMRSSAKADGQISNGEEESSVKDTVFEVISTIMTIDFFVVIGLLVWFLAGIFCSTVLKNDAVQIAFNMNFERVTQP